uniref:Uncharacterized protein n=1 Tax=Anguilla anguilla TaxID=7936 RepID=A0A0E9XRG0_ANGAN
MTVVWDVITSPGVCAALAAVTLSGTIMRALKSLFPPPPEWECTWITGQELCPSTASLTQ